MNVKNSLVYSIASLVISSLLVSQNANAQVPFKAFFIENIETDGKCIDVVGAPGIVNGDQLQLFDCEVSGRHPNGTKTDQRWAFMPNGAFGQPGSFIQNTNYPGKCIDVEGAPGRNNGDKLQLYTCEWGRYSENGNPTDQLWRLRSGFLENANYPGKCIDVFGAPGRNNGDKLQLFDCESTSGPGGSQTDQTWRQTVNP